MNLRRALAGYEIFRVSIMSNFGRDFFNTNRIQETNIDPEILTILTKHYVNLPASNSLPIFLQSHGKTMVYYFTSNVIDPPATIYVGKDKFESRFSLAPLISLSTKADPHHLGRQTKN